MRRKLVLEISRNETLLRQAVAERIAQVPVASAPAGLGCARGTTEVLRSGPNAFTDHCDNFTGPLSFGPF